MSHVSLFASKLPIRVGRLFVLSLLSAAYACDASAPDETSTTAPLAPGGATADAGTVNSASGGTAGTASPATAQAVPASGGPGAQGVIGGVSTHERDVCQTQVLDAYGAIPDMLIVLDRSQSMTIYGRWEPSKSAIKAVTSEFQGLMSFGLEVFPGDSATESDPSDPNALLSAGVDILSGSMGSPAVNCAGGEKLDVPLKLRNAMSIADTLDRVPTRGLTPTGAALREAGEILGDRTQLPDRAVKPGYVLLVTDGEPSCNFTLVVQGAADTMQEQDARAAIQELKRKAIPTYVVGYQIDPAFQPFMNELAMLGGTMSYRPAENGEQIVAAFREITKDVIKCSFALAEAPKDPTYVRVQIDGVSIPLNDADGWEIRGNTIKLQGGACAKLKDGKGHDLRAQLECNEVILN